MTFACCCCSWFCQRQNSDSDDDQTRPLIEPDTPTSSMPESCHSSLILSSELPNIMKLCIREIESRGLGEEGLYRKCGRKSDVDKLRDQFKNNCSPELGAVTNIHVVCNCLTGYLNNLSECLLSSFRRTAFIKAAGIDDRELSIREIRRNIDSMLPNYREILAVLILHLQRVAESPACRMDHHALAVVFGPAVVGWSDERDRIRDPPAQQLVMKKLFSVPAEVWSGIVAEAELTLSTCI